MRRGNYIKKHPGTAQPDYTPKSKQKEIPTIGGYQLGGVAHHHRIPTPPSPSPTPPSIIITKTPTHNINKTTRHGQTKQLRQAAGQDESKEGNTGTTDGKRERVRVTAAAVRVNSLCFDDLQGISSFLLCSLLGCLGRVIMYQRFSTLLVGCLLLLMCCAVCCSG